MPRLILTLFCCFCLTASPAFAAQFDDGVTKPLPVMGQEPETLTAALVASIAKEMKAPAPGIEVRALKNDTVRVAITAEKPYKTMSAAQAAGKQCVIGAVKAVMATGHNPGKEDILISCYVYSQEGAGLTGKQLVRSYGVGRYDALSDSFRWEDAK